MNNRKPYLFMSYASVDRERALAAAQAIEQAGIPVWIDKSGIAGGASWAEEIVGAIRNCALAAVLCSPASMQSRNVRQELQLAWEENRPILPLLLEPVDFPDAISYFLRGRQWIDLTNRPQAEWMDEMTAAIRRIDPPGLPLPESAPVSEAPAVAAHLPVFATRMVGREREQQELFDLLGRDEPRLITLAGPGGIGKTRLALETMSGLDGRFPGGRYFVDLAPVPDPAQVAAAIGRSLGLHEGAGGAQAEILKRELATRKGVFLLLDNFEHVIDAAPLVGELIGASPDLRIVITSRESLRIRGEYELPVQPLALPERMPTLDLETVAGAPAVALFIDTAAVAKPGFALSDENATAVAQICRRLDGLPLAIELAAARVRHFPPDVLLQNLTSRLSVLTGGRRDQPARQQTLARAIAWSYDLLPPEEQRLFRLLSVFVGGASYDDVAAMADAVSDSGEHLDLVSGLASLVEKNLLRERHGPDGMPRFSMFETIREFGENASRGAGEQSSFEEAHARHFYATTESFPRGLTQPFGAPEYIPRVDLDIDNYRAAIAWFHLTGDATASAWLACRLYDYFYLEGLNREGGELLRKSLECARHDPIDDDLHGLVLASLGHSVTTTSDPSEGERVCRLALERLNHASDPFVLHATPESLMISLRDQGRFGESLVYAQQLYEQALELGDPAVQTCALYHVGKLHWLLGEMEDAAERLVRSIDLATACGADQTKIYASIVLTQVMLRRGEVSEAVPLLRALHREWSEAGYRGLTGPSLEPIAVLATLTGQLALAARLSSFCIAYENQLGLLRLKAWLVEILHGLRDELGDLEFERLSADGVRMTMDEAVALAETALDYAENSTPPAS